MLAPSDIAHLRALFNRWKEACRAEREADERADHSTDVDVLAAALESGERTWSAKYALDNAVRAALPDMLDELEARLAGEGA